MKICPRCQKTYPDDNLNFCLEDGSVLTQVTGQAMPETVLLNEPRITAQPQQQQSQPSAQGGWNVPPQQQYSMQPAKKSSKTWLWVLLILGGIILICGGGFVGMLAYIGSQADNIASNVANTLSNKGTANKGTTNSNSTTTTTSTSDRSALTTVDLSEWIPDSAKFAAVEFTDGELFVKNHEKTFYYVLAGTEDQKSVGSDTRITVRNVENIETNLGYGIVFHSDTTPLQQGYAFVIDAKRKRYRVVRHSPKNETAVVNWSRSDAIREGTASNTLEVRDQSATVDLYINGTKVNSIKNTYGYPNGVVGIYASNALKVAFKDFEIRK
jgi:hypothetical protein